MGFEYPKQPDDEFGEWSEKVLKDADPLGLPPTLDVLRENPTLVGIGAESIVITKENEQGEIVEVDKVNLESVRNAVQLDPDFCEQLALMQIEHMQKKFNELQDAFGSEHVMDQTFLYKEIPLTKEIIEKAFAGRKRNPLLGKPGGTQKPDPTSAKVVMSVQPDVSAIREKKVLSATSYYAEAGMPRPTKKDFDSPFVLLTDYLVFGIESDDYTFSENEFFEIQKNPHLEGLVQEAKHNEQLREEFKHFVESAAKYYRDFGEILDTAGTNNIVFFKENERWTYRVIDGIMPEIDDTQDFEKTDRTKNRWERALEVADTHDTVQIEDRWKILGFLNNLRTINGIAECLNFKTRIEVDERSLPKTKIDWLMLLRNGNDFKSDENLLE